MTSKYFLPLLILLCMYLNTFSQVTYQKTYSINSAYSVEFSSELTSDGGAIITGHFEGLLTWDAFLLRLNAAGDTLWTRTYDSGTDDRGLFAIECFDGGFAMCGNENLSSFTDRKTFLLKTDASGNTQWIKNYYSGPNICQQIIQVPDSGFVICGNWMGSSNGGMFIQTDQFGNVLNGLKLGNNVSFKSVLHTADGGIIFTGDGTSLWLVKKRADGSFWNKLYLPAEIFHHFSSISSTLETSDGDLVIATMYDSQDSAINHIYDICLIRTDSTGVPEWSFLYDGLGEEEVFSIAETQDNGFLVTGWTFNDTINHELFILKVDSIGAIQWFKTYGGPAAEFYTPKIHECTDGSIFLTASSPSFNTSTSVYCIMTNQDGYSGCYEGDHITSRTPINFQYYVNATLDSPKVIVTGSPVFIESSGAIVTDICISTVSHENFNSISELLIYPNPVSGILKIKSPSLKIISLSILNTLGKKLMTVNLPNAHCQLATVLDVSSLPPGIYFLNATTNEGIATARFIKN